MLASHPSRPSLIRSLCLYLPILLDVEVFVRLERVGTISWEIDTASCSA